MNPRDIPEIREADHLLQTAERSFPSEESAEEFSEAFEILNDYLDNRSPVAAVENFIVNVKLSYTRSTLNNLNEINTKDVDIFFHYLVVLILKMKPEVDALRMQHPDLGTAFDSCRERFKPQLDEIIDELQHDI